MGNEQPKIKKESDLYNVVLTPITPKFHSSLNYDFFIDHGEMDISKETNYGFLSAHSVHEILLYLQPQDLISVFQTCKLIYKISSTSFWWERYYKSYFKDDEEEDKSISNNEKGEKYINWKKLFFHRFYFLSDRFYRERFESYMDFYHRNLYRKKIRECEEEQVDPVDFEEEEEEEEKLKFKNSRIDLVVAGSEVSHSNDFLEFIVDVEFRDTLFKKKRKEGLKIHHELRVVDKNEKKEIRLTVSEYLGIPFVEKQEKTSIGVFLIFNIFEKKCFKKTKLIYKELVDSEIIDEFSLCLLIGIRGDGMKKNKEEHCKERAVVSFDKASRFAKKNNLLGYIECDLETKENYFLCFGVLLDGILRREKKKNKYIVRKRIKKKYRGVRFSKKY